VAAATGRQDLAAGDPKVVRDQETAHKGAAENVADVDMARSRAVAAYSYGHGRD